MTKVVSIVLNNFKNDSRVLKENISLQNNEYNVQVIALWEDGVKEFELVQSIPIHRVKLISKNWPKNKLVQLLKYFEFSFRVVIKYKNNDIIHCNDLNTLPIGVLIKKFFNKNVKIVYDAHEYETETNDLKGFQKTFVKKLEKLLIPYADKVITVSDTIANEYVKLYNIQKPTLVLNAPPYKEIEKKDIFRDSLNIPKEKTIFLYQGRLSKGRGIEILIETFQNINDNQSVIVFMGYGILEEKIKTVSQNSDTIYFHPAVSPDILLDYTSSADFGIATIEDSCLSYRYCLPNKMFEYIMTEVPVIVSNLPEMRKIIEKYQVGVIMENNTEEKLQEALKEATQLKKDSLQKNLQNVKKIYNWQEQEKNLLDVYRAL